MKKIFNYLSKDPRNDMTLKSMVLKRDFHDTTQPSFAKLNRAGRTVERLVTLGGIALAFSTAGVGIIGLGLAVAAKGAGLVSGAGVSKAVQKINKKMNPYG